MVDEIHLNLAEIKGTLAVIKGWGIGIAGIVTAIGLAGLVFSVNTNSQVSRVSAQLDQLSKNDQQATQQRLNEIQSSLNRLLAERQPAAPSKNELSPKGPPPKQ